ncbi:TPA: YgiW/YdeI family stress tolerance OB fold protein [Cronobacter turicensis]|nr:YgiW/YdeI family stress tolerance OB fold protein [Cronobacter turicensis]
MIKAFITVLFSLISFSVLSSPPGFNSPEGQGYIHGGFSGAGPELTNVSVARTLPDDAWVKLEGRITRRIGYEIYEFKDATGTIMVEIDDKYWMGQSVSPETLLQIEGEIERDWSSLEVDVKSLRIIK